MKMDLSLEYKEDRCAHYTEFKQYAGASQTNVDIRVAHSLKPIQARVITRSNLGTIYKKLETRE